jgi:uncharacterized membrane protein
MSARVERSTTTLSARRRASSLVLAASIAAIRAWQQGRLAPNWSFHFGLVLTGWGIFNVVEGLIDHQILGVHHVLGTILVGRFLGTSDF